MASRRERGLFDPDAAAGESPFDHFIYVVAGDGCMEEGVASEASSLAGHQQLGNLILFYDDNHISIEDDTAVAFSEDVLARYEAYGWHVQRVDSGEDVIGARGRDQEGAAVTDKPSFIAVRTIIGWPAPTKQNTGKAHGSALGDEEIRKTKKILGFDPDVAFYVDDEVLAHARQVIDRGREAHAEWQKEYDAWADKNKKAFELHERLANRTLPSGWTEALPTWPTEKDGKANAVSTRKASGEVLTKLAQVLPELWGGSADLAESNNTTMEGEPSFVPAKYQTKMWQGGPYGRTLHFGIREHAMGAILNGINVHGGTRAYGGTFLVFSDYMRPPVRLAALMGFRRSSCGPTTPSGWAVTARRTSRSSTSPRCAPSPASTWCGPADPNETAACWRRILEKTDGPAGIALSRQNLRVLDPVKTADAGKGAYVLEEASTGRAQVIIIATGSEVELALQGTRLTRGRRHAYPGRIDAVRRVVRGAARVLPPADPAARGQGQGQRGGRRQAGLARVRRRGRRNGVDRALRRQRRGRRAVRAVRIHTRPGGSSRPFRIATRRKLRR